MQADLSKPLNYFKHAYSQLLPVFMGDIMDAGGDFDALSSATARLCDSVLELSKLSYSLAVILTDYVDLSDKLKVHYFESTETEEEGFKKVLELTTGYLVENPVYTASAFTLAEIGGCEDDSIINPDSILIIPIRSATATCGYTAIYYHDNAERHAADSPQVTFISKIMYLVALTFQCEFSKAMLEHYLMNDHLTELPNRDHIYEAIVYMLQTAEAFDQRFALLIIRVNGLRSINNSLGIITGDLMIKAVGGLIESAVSENTDFDTLVGRLSGGDFVVLITLPAMSRSQEDDAVTVTSCCNAIINKTEHHVEINGYKLYPSVNIGASIYPYHGETAEELLRKADLAKNSAKSAGPGLYRTYESYLDGDAEEILFLNSNLPSAISSNQFVMFYQALVDVKTEKITTAEALIRWQHPERGMVFPGTFMPFAEKNAYGIQIDLLVLTMACQQINAWLEKGIDLTVSVNISPRHFYNGLIYDSVSKVLSANKVDPSRLRLEILETIVLDDFASAVKVISDLASLGVGIALDDFGSGYSSLEYVAKLPLDYLKIDRSFLMNLEENPSNRIILETIMTLANGMKVKTVAEGVETKRHFDFLREIGCDVAQGYFINKPMDPKTFDEFLEKWKI